MSDRKQHEIESKIVQEHLRQTFLSENSNVVELPTDGQVTRSKLPHVTQTRQP